MRVAHDSTTATDIPADATFVKGYVDGRYRWTQADWDRFPNAVKVRTACFASTDDGHELDIEDGCSTPQQAPGWVAMRRRAGVDPTVYCNLSTWPTCRQAFADQGVPEPHWDIAHYTGIPHLIDGSVATQYADEKMTGFHFDLSLIADYWPGVEPDPSTGGGGTHVAQLDDIQSSVNDARGTLGEIWNSQQWGTAKGGQVPQGWLNTQVYELGQKLDKIIAQLAAIPGTPSNTAALKAIQDAITRIENALKTA